MATDSPQTTRAIWPVSAIEADGLRTAFERELADHEDPRRRRAMSDALALGRARVRAERDGARLSEDTAARHVVAEQTVLAPWRSSQGLAAIEGLAVTGEPIDPELEMFLAAVGLPALRATG